MAPRPEARGLLRLLDAHASGPRVGRRLEADGHDVRALDQEPELEGLDDEEVLSAAAAEQRILVTHNTRDVPAILREWAAGQRPHAGVILVYGSDHREFDTMVGGTGRCLDLYPAHNSWRDTWALSSIEIRRQGNGRQADPIAAIAMRCHRIASSADLEVHRIGPLDKAKADLELGWHPSHASWRRGLAT